MVTEEDLKVHTFPTPGTIRKVLGANTEPVLGFFWFPGVVGRGICPRFEADILVAFTFSGHDC